jgi:hypothetical protein
MLNFGLYTYSNKEIVIIWRDQTFDSGCIAMNTVARLSRMLRNPFLELSWSQLGEGATVNSYGSSSIQGEPNYVPEVFFLIM